MEHNVDDADYFREEGEFGVPVVRNEERGSAFDLSDLKYVDEEMLPMVNLVAALAAKFAVCPEDQDDLMQAGLEFLLRGDVCEEQLREYIKDEADKMYLKEDAVGEVDGVYEVDEGMIDVEDLFQAVIAARMAIKRLEGKGLLSSHQAEVVMLRLGLEDGVSRTNGEIGAARGVTGAAEWRHYSNAMEVIRRECGQNQGV